MWQSRDEVFVNIIEGSFNTLAVRVLQAAKNRDHHYNPIVIWAGTGLGKSTLLHALKDSVEKERSVTCLNCVELIDLIISSLREQMLEELISALADVDYFLIDDTHLLEGKLQIQHVVSTMFRRTMDRGGQVVMTSLAHTAEIPVIHDFLLECPQAIVADIQPPGKADRERIIRAEKDRHGWLLSEDEIALAADPVEENISSLLGRVHRITAEKELGIR